MKRFALILFAIASFGSVAVCADVMEVSLRLPSRAKLKLTGDEKIAIAPFVITSAERDTRGQHSDVDVQAEFARFLRKELAKDTKLKLVTVPTTRLPGNDMKALEADKDFWRDLAARTGADYLVSGVIDFDVQEKAGYKTEEYVSPVDGRTYYRQVLVENTGFVFDVVVGVFNGDTGEKVLEENFRDFKQFDQSHYDELLGLFENLHSLRSQLLGIFVAQETPTTRYLFNR